LTCLDKIFAADQSNAEACYLKARILSTCPKKELRNGPKAIELAERALEISKRSIFMDTLAAAYAETGNFKMAVKFQRKAITILKNEGKEESIPAYTSRLDLYLKKQPFREY
jgi:tetratricopeptide (TPR) repeat protein